MPSRGTSRPASRKLCISAACTPLADRPGITGLWQVNGRSSLEHEDRCALDREYAEEWSLGMDASILLRTPLAVLRPHHTA